MKIETKNDKIILAAYELESREQGFTITNEDKFLRYVEKRRRDILFNLFIVAMLFFLIGFGIGIIAILARGGC